MEVQRRAEWERFVAGVTDETMELTDAATEIRLTPNLTEETTKNQSLENQIIYY